MSRPKTSNRDYGYQPNMANGVADLESQVTTSGVSMSGKVEKHSEFMNPNEQPYEDMEYLYPTYSPFPPIDWPTPTWPGYDYPTPVWPGMPNSPTYPDTPGPESEVKYVRDVVPGCVAKFNMIPTRGGLKTTNDMLIRYPNGNWLASYVAGYSGVYWQSNTFATPTLEPFNSLVHPGGITSGSAILYSDGNYPLIPKTGPFTLSIIFMLKTPLNFHQHYDANGKYIYIRCTIPDSSLSFSHNGMTAVLFGTWGSGKLDDNDPVWWAQPSDEPYYGQTAYPGPSGYDAVNTPHTSDAWNSEATYYQHAIVSVGEDNYVCVVSSSTGSSPPSGDWRLCEVPHYGIKPMGLGGAAGLFIYNGNRLLGCRRIANEPSQGQGAISNPLSYNVWYHAALSVDSYGAANMLLTERNNFGVLYYAPQLPTSNEFTTPMGNYVWMGCSRYNIVDLISPYTVRLTDIHDNANVVLAKPRIYNRALTEVEMEILAKEAFRQTYITEKYFYAG